MKKLLNNTTGKYVCQAVKMPYVPPVATTERVVAPALLQTEMCLPEVIDETDAALRAKAMALLRADFKTLLDPSAPIPEGWVGSRSDLFEMVHLVYRSVNLTNARGEPLARRVVLEALCRRLGLRMPANPSAVTARACQSKGVRRNTLWERYLHRAYNEGQRTAGQDNKQPAQQ